MRVGQRRQLAWRLAAISGLAGLCLAVLSSMQPAKAQSQDVHLGVATCAGSTCHGAPTPWRNSLVQQTEYMIWHTKDRHAQAYKALTSEAGQRIARNLGIPAAHEAKICLDCHTDNVAPALRSKSFQLSDGVGCEACHGGSQRWLGVHVSGVNSREQTLAAGMRALDDPVSRGKLCLGCHLGTADRWVTHKIMGAGHPRLRFELDTYTQAQPAHFRVDEDYRRRKKVASPARTWILGQALAVDYFLDGLMDPKVNAPGVFPELTLYNCHACHHPMSERRFEPRAEGGLSPGQPSLQDANLVMLRVALETLDPALAGKLSSDIRALHESAGQGREAQTGIARSIKSAAEAALQRAQREPSREEVAALLNRLIALAGTQGYRTYAVAEQTTMALGAMLAHMRQAGLLDAAQYKRANDALDAVYKTVEREDQYQVTPYANAVQMLKSALPAL